MTLAVVKGSSSSALDRGETLTRGDRLSDAGTFTLPHDVFISKKKFPNAPQSPICLRYQSNFWKSFVVEIKCVHDWKAC